MKLKHLAAAAGLSALYSAALPATARADVTWEHTGTVRVSSFPEPLVKVKMYSSFAERRERYLLNYQLSPLLPVPIARHGSLGLVSRLDDDRFIAWDSQTRQYASESRKLILSKLFVDYWKNVAPELSKEPVPELTEAQRKRLGAELRATLHPVLKRYSRTYFRPLTEKRSWNGIDGRGYRMTQLINTSRPGQKGAKWATISFEWWLAGDLPGDEIIRGLQAETMDSLRAAGWPGKSMWNNETGYVLLYSLPEAYMTALRTFAPGPSLSEPGFGGTPLELNVTVSMPQSAGLPVNEVRAQLSLNNRFNSELAESVFTQPANYKRFDMKPLLKQYDEAVGKSFFEEFFRSMENNGGRLF